MTNINSQVNSSNSTTSLDMTTTLTSQYQLHLPKAIREVAGLMAHGKIKLHAEVGKITITPATELDLQQFAGCVPNRSEILVENIRDYIDYTTDYNHGE
ncbi:MAG TPA: hypothetical protein DEP87_00370 [Candidatus Pacebacteria bacterium]|nr:hypothetical protein [Candidatus Paceibacterota bacterium]